MSVALTAVEALRGRTFSTPGELRQLAEAALRMAFVPTETLSRDDANTRIILLPAGIGRIMVSANRERHWYPYRIEFVELLDGASVPCG